MAESETANRRIIYDRPAQADAFTGGGHARTANALAKLIREFDAETRAIGLEGRWGSGKSSILEMAKKKLEENAAQQEKTDRRAYHIFTYDLWAHQTGNFRRTFLEQLISWLRSQPGSDERYLSEIYDQITNRTIRTKTENTKTFSIFGLVALLFLLLLPLVYMWLSPFASANSTASPRGWYAKVAVGGMAALTLLQIGITWWKGRALGNPVQLVKRWWNGEPLAKVNRAPSLLDAVSRTLSLFSKDAETANIEQRVREIDPSQHEFEETFKEIVSRYQTVERRIIIVFDNVDRLPADKIKDAWSDVRAMVSADRPSDGPERKITLIIPYDREHILNAIKSTDEDKQIQEDLLRKSFDAILFVAPPVIADASAFFELKFEEALGSEFDKEMGYRAYKIFDLSCMGGQPTPRQIIAFINAVAGLWDEWEGRIALPTIALFMTHREKLARDPGILRRPNEIDERQRDLADDGELFKHLAALAYNVEPDYAFQVLLHGPIEQLFTGSSPDKEVNEITKSPGWDTILPDIYRAHAPVWAETSVAQFRNAVRNLAALDASPSKKLESKRALLGAVSKLSTVPSTSWEGQEDLIRLFELCDMAEGRKLTKDFAEWLQRSLPKVEERSFAQGRHWIDFMGKIYNALATRYGHDGALEMLAAVSFPPGDQFLVGVAYDTDQTKLHLEHFKNVPRSKGLVAPMTSRLIESPDQFYYAWPEVRYLLDKGQPATFAETLGNHLRQNKVGDTEKLSFMLLSYNRLIANSTTTESLTQSRRDLVNDGALYYHIDTIRKSESKDVDDALAAVFWLILNQTKGKVPAVPDLQSHAFGNLNATRDWLHTAITDGEVENGLLTEIAALVRNRSKLSEWIDWAASAPALTRLLQNVIVAVVQETKHATAAPAILAKNHDFLKGVLGDDLDTLLAHTGARRTPEEWSALDPAKLPLSFIADNAKRQEPGFHALYAKIDQWLAGQDADALKQSLFDETHTILVLSQRVKDADFTVAPEKLKTAITEHVLAVLSGEQQSEKNFDTIWNAVPPNSRTGLATDMLDHLERAVVTSAGMNAALTCYPALMAQLPLSKRADVAARKIVLRLVELSLNRSHPALAFLETNKKQIQQVMKKAEDESIIGEFRDHLESRPSEDEEGAIQVRQTIYGILGITPPVQPFDESGGGDRQAQETQQNSERLVLPS